MKLTNTFLIILVTLSFNSTAYSISYSQLENTEAEPTVIIMTEPNNDIEEDDEDEC